jgi:multidrug efflux pump subunit AcrA (membrane-fusion protein)
MKKLALSITAALSALALAAILVSCGGKKADSTAKGDAAKTDAAVFAVNTQPVTRGRIQNYLPLSGDVVAISSVMAYPDAAGKIARLPVSLGERVRKNQILAMVDPSKPGMQYALSPVRSPIAGIITSLPLKIGATVSQAVAIATIAGTSGLEVDLYVSERNISEVAMNQTCVITVDAWPADTFLGAVTEISPVVDPVTRTLQIKVTVTDPKNKLKAGMFAKVKIITDQKANTVKIPDSALIRRNGEVYVFVVGTKNGQKVATKKDVKPGIDIDGVLEIEEGLKADDELIVQGQSLLEDGTPVNVVSELKALPKSAGVQYSTAKNQTGSDDGGDDAEADE